MRNVKFQWVLVALGSLALLAALACTQEVVKEVPVEKVITQEVVREVPVEKIVEVERETVRTVEVEKPIEVIREVVKEVQVPGQTVVVTQVEIKEVPVEKVVVREVERPAVITELRIANTADPSFLDIHRGQSGHDIFHGRMIFETMLFFDPTMMNPDPGLARSWQISPDGLTYDLNLRDNVVYHNGAPFTSSDAIWNYDRCIIELKEKSRCGNELQNVVSYTALDDYTIRMNLNQFSVVFPTQLATTPGFMFRDNVVSGEVDTNPIGTGEFRFIEFIPGDRLVMEKNQLYWDRGKLQIRPDRVVVIPIMEEQTRVASLKAGEVDLVAALPYQFVDEIRNFPGLQVIEQKGGLTASYMTVIMNTRERAMADVRVRKAMQLAINKQVMHKTIWFGFGEVDCNLIPSNHWAYDPVDCPERDLDAAKALLKEAGYDESNPLKIKYLPEPGGEMFQKIGEVLKQNVAEAGIDMEVVVVDSATWLDKVWFGVECDGGHAGICKEYDIGDAWYTRTPDPDGLMQSVLRAKTDTSGWGGNNGMRYRNQRVEDLFDLGKGTTDRQARKGYYKEIIDIVVNQDVPLIKIQSMPRFYGVSERVQDAHISPKGYWNSRDYTFASQ